MKTKNILISGSLAYDYIMDFPGNFSDHILPEYTHILNVSFSVDTLQKNMGGCAGNIAYTIKLLNGNPIIVGALGVDSKEYLDHLQSMAIEKDHIYQDTEKHTSSAFITTDKNNNQIAAFYTGAGSSAKKISTHHTPNPDIAIITAGDVDAMCAHARECKSRQIPTIIDPSHQLPALSTEQLKDLITGATWYIANDYEMKLTEDKLNMSMKDILSLCSGVIVTLGEKGSILKTQSMEISVPAAKVFSITDPTGAGDAFRAGFISFLASNHDYTTCLRAGNICAAYTIEHYGTQKHNFSIEEFVNRYTEAYNEHPQTAL